jgi:hypothetical protein
MMVMGTSWWFGGQSHASTAAAAEHTGSLLIGGWT